MRRASNRKSKIVVGYGQSHSSIGNRYRTARHHQCAPHRCCQNTAGGADSQWAIVEWRGADRCNYDAD
jgi:hypothetical protein